jgi:hypothetical protein
MSLGHSLGYVLLRPLLSPQPMDILARSIHIRPAIFGQD